MNYGKASLKSVMARVYRDLPVKNGLDWQDYLSWMGDAVEHLHVTNTLAVKTETLKVTKYRANWPCDFYIIGNVNYNSKPLRYGSAINSVNTFLHAPNSCNLTVSGGHDYYTVNNTFLSTSFKEGEVQLTYYAIEVDSEGSPIIPNSQMWYEALVRYVDMKIGYKEWRTGKISRTDYDKLEEMWGSYCLGAQNDSMFPDIAQMENMRAMFIRFMPIVNNFDNNFDTLTLPQF